MLKKSSIAVFGAIAFGASFTTAAHAFQVFTDRTDWENAMDALGAGVLTTDTFSNDIFNATSITFDSGVVSTGTNGVNENDVENGQYFGVVDTDGDVDNLFETINWTFPKSIIGFGADFRSATTGEVLQVSGKFDGSDKEMVDFGLLGINNSFLGIVGEASFSEITFTSRTDNSTHFDSERFAVDNLSFGSQPVPEPMSVLAVLAMGVITAGGMFRKQQSV